MSPSPSLEHIRHTLAHLVAHAVQDQWPQTKFAIGPTIEHGFYYDLDPGRPLTAEDLKPLEKRMKHLIKQNLVMEKISADDPAVKAFLAQQPLKQELFAEITAAGQTATFYRIGKFIDLCRGGHVDSTAQINPDAFRLSHVAGAYWRGDSTKPMLQRIYGLTFATKAELDQHLQMQQEAAKRDHRKLNADLKIFTTSDLVGPGLPLWLPNGTILIEELERLAKETEAAAGYQRVVTPHIAKEEMYTTSGHLPYYADSMFPPMALKEDETVTRYYLRAMNCPHHHVIYASQPRSYRELPLRLAEYGTVYRYEKSGELFGLMRVRAMHMNDAHLYMTPEQFATEFNAVNKMYIRYFKLFGIKKYVMRFSTHDPKELGKKYVDEPELWNKTEGMVRKVLKKSNVHFVEVPNEAAFYGPKIDVQIYSSIGREFTIATNQVDFAQPRRFHLSYTDSAGQPQVPLCIHRAPLGTHERFIGFLIEHFGGLFPLWLSPIQVQVIPVARKHNPTGKKLAAQLLAAGIRTQLDDSDESVGYKIRKAEKQKVPYMVVVGDKEKSLTTLAVRVRGKKQIKSVKLKTWIPALQNSIAQRTLNL